MWHIAAKPLQNIRPFSDKVFLGRIAVAANDGEGSGDGERSLDGFGAADPFAQHEPDPAALPVSQDGDLNKFRT